MSSKMEGSFPLACVAGLDSTHNSDGESARESWAYSRRASSLNGTNYR